MGGTSTASEVPAAFDCSKPHSQISAGTKRTTPPIPIAPLMLPTVKPIARKSRILMDDSLNKNLTAEDAEERRGKPLRVLCGESYLLLGSRFLQKHQQPHPFRPGLHSRG